MKAWHWEWHRWQHTAWGVALMRLPRGIVGLHVDAGWYSLTVRWA